MQKVFGAQVPRLLDRSGSRENNFDFLRLLLATVVLQYHSFPCSGRTSHGFLARMLTLQIGGGWEAVNCFFVISGFLIAGSWERTGGLAKFLTNRFLRIYPGFITAMVVCAFIIGPMTGAKLPEYLWDPHTYLFFKPLVLGPVEPLPGILGKVPWSGVVNGSIWTIRFEIMCYLLLAALGLCGLLRRPLTVLLLLVISLTVSQMVLSEWPHGWVLQAPFLGSLWELPRLASAFLAGVTAYVWRRRIPYHGLLAVLAMILLLVGMRFKLDAIFFPVCVCYLVLFVAFSRWIPLQHIGSRGDYSYGIYLYAFPIQQLLVYWIPISRMPLVLTVMALPITFLLAVVSWKLIEQPCLRLKRRSRTLMDRQTDHVPSIESTAIEAAPAN